jgi:AraC family ethanolamine operon transcriptional activator
MGSLSRRAPDPRWPLTSDISFDAPVTVPFGCHDYAGSVSDAGVNFMVAQPIRNSWQASRHSLGRTVLQSGTAGGATIADGVSKRDTFVFFLPYRQHSHSITLNGEVAAIDDIVVLPPGREFAVASRGTHKWISISVPPTVLEEAGFSPVHVDDLAAAASLIRAPHQAARQLVAAAMDAMDTVQINSTSANTTRLCDIERALLAALLGAVVPRGVVAHAPFSRNSSNLDRVIHKALGFLRTKDRQDLHVEDLCRTVGVAERSLLRAFHRFFGVGPTQYLKLRRLNNVRCALQTHDCRQATVTEVLTTWGVTELGRFAGAYKALFGESPSETLRKKTGAQGPRHLPGSRCGAHCQRRQTPRRLKTGIAGIRVSSPASLAGSPASVAHTTGRLV